MEPLVLYNDNTSFKKYIKDVYDKIWFALKDFQKNGGLIRHHIDSFDWFIQHGIKKIILTEPIIKHKTKNKKVIIEILDIFVDSPVVVENLKVRKIYPHEARTRNLTYEGNININISETVIEKYNDETVQTINQYNNITIGKIPIMVFSSVCNLYNKNSQERVKLGECPYDSGGYFIIKGNEKGNERVLITQKRNGYNIPTIIPIKSKDNSDDYILSMRSMSEDTGHSAEIKLYTEEFSVKIIINKLKSKRSSIPIGIIFKALGYSSDDMIKLIGINIDKLNNNGMNKNNGVNNNGMNNGMNNRMTNAKQNIKLDYCLNTIISECDHIKTQFEAYKYINSCIITDNTKNINASSIQSVKDLFPHLGIESTKKEKAVFLGFLVKKLLLVKSGYRKKDIRDNISNKRYETTGILFYELYRYIHKQWCSKLKEGIEKNQNILNILTKDSIITSNITTSITTPNWGVARNKYKKIGVSQILNNMNYICTESHKRRIATPISKDGKGKNMEIRKMNASQIFFECPSETPEGQKVGIITNMAFTCAFSNKVDTVFVKEYMEELAYEESLNGTSLNGTSLDGENLNSININSVNINDVDINTIKNMVPVFLNGILVSFTDTPENYVNKLRRDRSIGKISPEISITYDFIDNEIRVWCDEGRVLRPLLNLNKSTNKKEGGENINNQKCEKENKKHIKILKKKLPFTNAEHYDWAYLVTNNYITYLHSDEIEYSDINVRLQDIPGSNKDYCELHPSLILGVCTGNIPLTDSSQSPRNCYGSSMGKQALGCYSLAYRLRTYTTGHIMCYLQKPLVHTIQSEISGYNSLPTGLNVNVAICCVDGFNQEDSVLISKGAVDRGLFHLISERVLCTEERKKNSYDREVIEFPSNEVIKNSPYRYNYSYLDQNGIIKKGVSVVKNDVLVGKVLIKQNKKEGTLEHSDCSLVITDDEDSGIVDRVITTTTNTGNKIVKIVVRRVRIPERGDKFCSREGQKGTCGRIVPVEDMPFNVNTGITPDIVINSHAIPSRMTVNQILETVMGKACALEGKYGDYTSFGKYCDREGEMKFIEDILLKHGHNRYGWETMCSGMSGKMLRCKVFCGPTYYHRLKHFVDDKVHARGSDGPITTLTRQPLEGRSRCGGLRLGEMEKDNLITHGVSRFLQSRTMQMSDGYVAYICDTCGKYCNKTCDVCKENGKISNVKQVKMPYCFKLMVHYMNGMCMRADIK